MLNLAMIVEYKAKERGLSGKELFKWSSSDYIPGYGHTESIKRLTAL